MTSKKMTWKKWTMIVSLFNETHSGELRRNGWHATRLVYSAGNHSHVGSGLSS